MHSQILYFSLPRSGCHMLERMLFSEQKNLKKCWHPLAQGRGYGEAGQAMFNWLQNDKLPEGSHEEFVEEQAKGVRIWQAELEQAKQKGETLYLHEHGLYFFPPSTFHQILTNQPPSPIQPSINLVPDTIVLLTIRHPILVVPSAYVANKTIHGPMSDANALVASHLGWNRYLYGFFEGKGVKVVVADAGDYMSDEEYVRKVASALDLDPEKVITSWPSMSSNEKEEMHPLLYKIQKTLVESKGLVKGRATKNIDLDAELKKWDEKYTPEEVKLFKKLVEIEMPHYEYLRERRLVA